MLGHASECPVVSTAATVKESFDEESMPAALRCSSKRRLTRPASTFSYGKKLSQLNDMMHVGRPNTRHRLPPPTRRHAARQSHSTRRYGGEVRHSW